MTSLDDIFNKVVDSMTESINITSESESHYFCYEDDNFIIEGHVNTSADFVRCGDGYYTPYEDVIVRASGELYDINIDEYDEDGDMNKVPEDVKDEFFRKLDDALQKYMK